MAAAVSLLICALSSHGFESQQQRFFFFILYGCAITVVYSSSIKFNSKYERDWWRKPLVHWSFQFRATRVRIPTSPLFFFFVYGCTLTMVYLRSIKFNSLSTGLVAQAVSQLVCRSAGDMGSNPSSSPRFFFFLRLRNHDGLFK